MRQFGRILFSSLGYVFQWGPPTCAGRVGASKEGKVELSHATEQNRERGGPPLAAHCTHHPPHPSEFCSGLVPTGCAASASKQTSFLLTTYILSIPRQLPTTLFQGPLITKSHHVHYIGHLVLLYCLFFFIRSRRTLCATIDFSQSGGQPPSFSKETTRENGTNADADDNTEHRHTGKI